MLSLDELQERYRKTETETDDFGRQITVGMLKPDQRTRVLELTDSKSQYVLAQFIGASSLRKIVTPDGGELLFKPPRTREDINIALNVLDTEGMNAVAKALNRLDPPKTDTQALEDGVTTAKN